MRTRQRGQELYSHRASLSGSAFFAVRGSKGMARVFATDHCHATIKDESVGLHEKENDNWKKRGEIRRRPARGCCLFENVAPGVWMAWRTWKQSWRGERGERGKDEEGEGRLSISLMTHSTRRHLDFVETRRRIETLLGIFHASKSQTNREPLVIVLSTARVRPRVGTTGHM